MSSSVPWLLGTLECWSNPSSRCMESMEKGFISQQGRLQNSKALRGITQGCSMARVSPEAQDHSLEEDLEQEHQVRSKTV